MKKLLNQVITKLLSYYYKKNLPNFQGKYFVSPKPPYLSQFVSILPASLKPSDLLTNRLDLKKYGAKDIKEFSFWAWRNCGIVCVKMILEAKGKAKNKTIMDLTREGIELGGYITHKNGKFVDEGWFHHSLVMLLHKYGLRSSSRKWQTIDSIAKEILCNKLVILSVSLPGRTYIKEDGSFLPKKKASYSGHLLLATGLISENGVVKGIFVHDPRGLKNYQKDTLITSDIFSKVFQNRTIVVD